MDPSGKSKYLTPCRTFGLQRTQTRTPSSTVSDLEPQGRASGSLNTPFRSPLVIDSAKSTPSAEKKKTSLPKPSWSTPLLPKSRVKMGLSKPSPKTSFFAKIESKNVIQTGVSESELAQSRSNGNRRLISSNRTTSIGHSNHMHHNTLKCAQTRNTIRSSHQSNYDITCDVERDDPGHQTDGQIVFQSAAGLPHSADETSDFSEEIEPPILPPHKTQYFDKFSSGSESDSDDNVLKICSLGDAKKELLNNSSNQESFHGWDVENDQESLDYDTRGDFFKKFISNFHTIGKVESCISNHSGASEYKQLVPSKKCSRANKLDFVKEKFKRRLLSDSGDSSVDADDNFSTQRKHSHELWNHAATDPLCSSENRKPSKTEDGDDLKSALLYSDDGGFIVRKPSESLPKNDDNLIPRTASKEDFNLSKRKLVVELCRLPDSALPGVIEGVGQSKRNSQSWVGDSDDGIQGFSALPNNLKTYRRAVFKKAKNMLKKLERTSYSRHPKDMSGTKRLSCPDHSTTLPNDGVQVVDDEIKRRFVECVGETEDFERMHSEMQKWLVGGQQVISQIIEEVRLQRDKDMSVMEVLQEHNIDPNLVGYDTAVEEFISFDTFLLRNNLL